MLALGTPCLRMYAPLFS
uniref:Uncharacterized protein n=1 Tax=Arundo donax TaxID=35708 RepID=A0A0A8YUF1_ARUDO